jgi:hypothetical protein
MTFVEATIVSSRRKADPAPRNTSPAATEAGPSPHRELTRPSAPLLGDPQELYIMFTRKHLAPEGPVDTALRELQASDSSGFTSARAVDCRTTHLQTVLSFATLFFGTKHGSPEITKQGYARHGATLARLNQTLSNPNCHMYDEVVVSVTTLAMQEMLVPSGPQCYLNHMLGLERLLALRGASSACSEKTVNLYKCLRHMMLYASLGAGRPSILAKPEWKALLRQYCESEAELQEQRLYDAVADCSVLMVELGDVVKRREDPDEDPESQIDRTRRRTQDLWLQLRDWREARDANPANTYIEVPANPQGSQHYGTLASIEPPSIPTDFVFQSTSVALTLMLYDTALIYVLHILITLPRESQPQYSREDYLGMAHSAVLEICRSMPDPSDEKLHADMHSSPVVYWAMQVAYMILQDDTLAEGRWLVYLLNRKSDKSSKKDLWVT